MERTAECHCGQLRVIATGEPERVYLCRCQACQRRTGTAFHFGASYPKEEDNPPVDARAARTILEMVTEGKPQLRASTLAARTTKGDDHDND